jgi:hypothetical protein
MIDEVSDVLGWNRKHAIKALNGKVSLGQKTRRRGSKATSARLAVWGEVVGGCE